jgi:dTDP-4-dehydrorhamnose reductase
MRILVTGTQGQVVSSLLEKAAGLPGIEVTAAGRPELDLRDRASVIRRIAAARPEVVVSAAAYTEVDRAEDEPEEAYRINVTGAGHVAEASAKVGASVIYLSSDYVFSGDHSGPYEEESDTRPLTLYGLTKLEGERATANANPSHIILRTSWVYSPFGRNFVKTMLRLAAERPTISVVSDQWGNPTSALDIADGILQIASQIRSDLAGVYHLAGAGEINWSGFARHIFSVSREHGGPFAEVTDISSADYPAKARRPLNSRLECGKIERAFGVRPRDWRASTQTVVQRLLVADRTSRVA